MLLLHYHRINILYTQYKISDNTATLKLELNKPYLGFPFQTRIKLLEYLMLK